MSVWRSLGHDALRPSAHCSVSLACAAVIASCAWYAARRGPVEQWLRDYGIQRSESVVILIWLGVILFYTFLWMRTGRTLETIVSHPSHHHRRHGLVQLAVRATWQFQFLVCDRPALAVSPGWLPLLLRRCECFARFILGFLLQHRVAHFRRPSWNSACASRGAARGGWIHVGPVLIVAPLVVVFYASTLPVVPEEISLVPLSNPSRS